MSLLLAIWAIALVLMAMALSWMAALIVQRLVGARLQRRRVARRRAIEFALLAVMQGRADAALALRPYQDDPRLIAETLLDFLGVVRGRDRELVVEALEAIGVPGRLRRRLSTGAWPGRLAAAEALAAFPGPETEAALRRLADRSPEARLTALEALARAGGQVSVDQLLDAASQGDLRLTGRFAEFLREQAAADPAGASLALARDDLAPELRILVLDALGGSGDYNAITVLAENARRPEPLVRAAAVRALGRLQHPAGQTAIAAGLDDPDAEVRAAAAEAAGEARLPKLAEALYGRLSDDAWRVRFQAAASLGRLGEPGLERLRTAAALSEPAPQRAASLTLAELGVV
ncbi:HEAT repeat domain-containing protein [Phenylobacterium sp. J426]|uniref:HEAT repeat domain-containing protein n=1 Tax=Phenylobacterium sp. J426 TaxID=2898439 RepID=UPI002151456A|nr:HEAT repeat domain-containing protein [Phenylobacterium sp. J426]MCR5872903.1 HEAT repeat domain-containing protein [Phenylobacterium sp. J426]